MQHKRTQATLERQITHLVQKLEHQRMLAVLCIEDYYTKKHGDIGAVVRHKKTLPILSQRLAIVHNLIKPLTERYN